MKFLTNLDIDASFKPLGGEFPCTVKKSITFAGATADAWGNDGGALDGGDIFTVTGLVKVRLFGVCTDSLTGDASTFSVGVAGATAIFVPVTTCTTIDVNEILIGDTTPAQYFVIGEEEAAADNFPIYLLNGMNIIGTVATANITGGTLDLYAQYRPMTESAKIVAA